LKHLSKLLAYRGEKSQIQTEGRNKSGETGGRVSNSLIKQGEEVVGGSTCFESEEKNGKWWGKLPRCDEEDYQGRKRYRATDRDVLGTKGIKTWDQHRS